MHGKITRPRGNQVARNRYGTTLGPRGYVLCQVTGCVDRFGKPVEVQEISKDTAPQHAKCRKHGTWAGDPLKREADKQAFFDSKRREHDGQ